MPPYANYRKLPGKKQETRSKKAHLFHMEHPGRWHGACRCQAPEGRTPDPTPGTMAATERTLPTRQPGAARSGLYSPTPNTLWAAGPDTGPAAPRRGRGGRGRGSAPPAFKQRRAPPDPDQRTEPSRAPTDATTPPAHTAENQTPPTGTDWTPPLPPTGAAPLRGPCGRAGEAQGSQGEARRSNSRAKRTTWSAGHGPGAERGADPARIAGAGAGLSLPPPPSWVGSNSRQPGRGARMAPGFGRGGAARLGCAGALRKAGATLARPSEGRRDEGMDAFGASTLAGRCKGRDSLEHCGGAPQTGRAGRGPCAHPSPAGLLSRAGEGGGIYSRARGHRTPLGLTRQPRASLADTLDRSTLTPWSAPPVRF
jgi:hypothetical protein